MENNDKTEEFLKRLVDVKESNKEIFPLILKGILNSNEKLIGFLVSLLSDKTTALQTKIKINKLLLQLQTDMLEVVTKLPEKYIEICNEYMNGSEENG